MREIKLTRGKTALVDDEDYNIVSLFSWQYNKANSCRAITNFKVFDEYISIYMHRLIMNAPQDIHVDHINHNGLDNRKENLRLCTQGQNNMNKLKSSNKSSKYKGVYWDRERKLWRANIDFNFKRKFLGRFSEEKAAAQAYDIMARKLHGEFAYFNNIGVLNETR